MTIFRKTKQYAQRERRKRELFEKIFELDEKKLTEEERRELLGYITLLEYENLDHEYYMYWKRRKRT